MGIAIGFAFDNRSDAMQAVAVYVFLAGAACAVLAGVAKYQAARASGQGGLDLSQDGYRWPIRSTAVSCVAALLVLWIVIGPAAPMGFDGDGWCSTSKMLEETHPGAPEEPGSVSPVDSVESSYEVRDGGVVGLPPRRECELYATHGDGAQPSTGEPQLMLTAHRPTTGGYAALAALALSPLLVTGALHLLRRRWPAAEVGPT